MAVGDTVLWLVDGEAAQHMHEWKGVPARSRFIPWVSARVQACPRHGTSGAPFTSRTENDVVPSCTQHRVRRECGRRLVMLQGDTPQPKHLARLTCLLPSLRLHQPYCQCTYRRRQRHLHTTCMCMHTSKMYMHTFSVS